MSPPINILAGGLVAQTVMKWLAKNRARTMIQCARCPGQQDRADLDRLIYQEFQEPQYWSRPDGR